MVKPETVTLRHSCIIAKNVTHTAFHWGLLYKVKLSLSAPWGHTGGVQVQLHSFLILAKAGGQWPTSCPSHFTPRKEPQYRLYRRLGGPQCRSAHFEEKISRPYWDSNLLSSSPQTTHCNSLRPLNEQRLIVMDTQYIAVCRVQCIYSAHMSRAMSGIWRFSSQSVFLLGCISYFFVFSASTCTKPHYITIGNWITY
jgi:hypothetical protein